MSFQSWHEEFDQFWLEHLKVPKNFIWMCSFWAKYIVWAKKVQRSYSSWNWIWTQIFGEKLTCRFKTDIMNLTNFDLSTRKSQKIFTLIGSFWAKSILFELKKYRAFIFHETEKGYKAWRGINLSFKNWHKEFDKFWP